MGPPQLGGAGVRTACATVAAGCGPLPPSPLPHTQMRTHRFLVPRPPSLSSPHPPAGLRACLTHIAHSPTQLDATPGPNPSPPEPAPRNLGPGPRLVHSPTRTTDGLRRSYWVPGAKDAAPRPPSPFSAPGRTRWGVPAQRALGGRAGGRGRGGWRRRSRRGARPWLQSIPAGPASSRHGLPQHWQAAQDTAATWSRENGETEAPRLCRCASAAAAREILAG
jgi:hypothetical protein